LEDVNTALVMHEKNIYPTNILGIYNSASACKGGEFSAVHQVEPDEMKKLHEGLLCNK